jgi:hypothetical protein
MGDRGSSAVEYLPTMHKDLGLISSTTKINNRTNEWVISSMNYPSKRLLQKQVSPETRPGRRAELQKYLLQLTFNLSKMAAGPCT